MSDPWEGLTAGLPLWTSHATTRLAVAWFALGIIAVAVLNKAAGGGPAGLFFAEAAVMIVAVPTVRRIERKACDIDFEVASYAFGHDEIVFVPDEWAGEESE